MLYTISKKFGPFPAAHRQWSHSGHCALIHGHNWIFEIVLGADSEDGLDPNGFVVDFGNMKELRKVLEDKFDHTLVLCEDDPFLKDLPAVDKLCTIAKVVVLNKASAEGMAKYVSELATRWLKTDGHYLRGVRVISVRCEEDEKNSAIYKRP